MSRRESVEYSPIEIISRNGYSPSSSLQRRLLAAEKRLARIKRLTISAPDGLNRFDTTHPLQAESILKTAVRIGTKIERINIHFKPLLEERVANIKQQLYENTEGTNRAFGKIRKLGEQGFLPPKALAIATSSYFVARAAMDPTINLSEQPTARETQISPLNTAIMALAIADAYVAQEGEQVFSLQGFYSFFGQCCAALPAREAAEIDAYQYKKLRQEAVEQFTSKANKRDTSNETPETSMLIKWIRTHIKNQNAFFDTVLATEDFGDINSHINLRDKLKKTLLASHQKYFSFHPGAVNKGTIYTRIIVEPTIREGTANTTGSTSEKPDSKKADLVEKIPVEEISLSEGDEHTLEWLIKGYRENEPTVVDDRTEARELALSAGIPIMYNQADEILALWNLTVSRANNGASLSPQTAERMRILIRKRLKRKPQKSI